MNKKMIINCTLCDARTVKERTLEAYENITINADYLLVTEESQALLNRCPVTMNVGNVLNLDGDYSLISLNGIHEIKPGPVPAKPVLLSVNGAVKIHPGSLEVLNQYKNISLNGTLLCPESLSACLGHTHINGQTICYPDESILMDSTFAPNQYFHRLAKQDALYFVPRRLILTDPKLDLTALREKNVHFLCSQLFVCDSLLDSALELLQNGENTDLHVLPDGCVYVDDDAVLDENLLKKYGPSLYISGDLTLNEDSTPYISSLVSPIIEGTVFLREDQADAFMAVNPAYEDLQIRKGKVLNDHIHITIDSALLASTPEGIHCTDCVNVSLSPDITRQEILDHLRFTDCVNITCTDEQKSAVSSVAEDCVNIGVNPISFLGDVFEQAGETDKTAAQDHVVNAETYVL